MKVQLLSGVNGPSTTFATQYSPRLQLQVRAVGQYNACNVKAYICLVGLLGRSFSWEYNNAVKRC